MIGSDLTFHLTRIMGLADAINEGQIPARIYPYANSGFGYGAPMFYCDILLLPFSYLYKNGVSVVICYKICVLFYTLLSNFFVYTIINKETNKRLLALTSVMLSLAVNYRMQNIFDRAGLSETIAICFVPLVFHAIYKVLIKKENSWIYLGISFSLLVLSHLLTAFLYAFFFLTMIIVYIVINRKDLNLIKRTLFTIVKATILGLLLTLWFICPMLEQFSSQKFWIDVQRESYSNNYGSLLIKYLLNFKAIDYSDAFNIKERASCGLVILVLSLFGFSKKNKYILIVLSFCIFIYLIAYGILPEAFLSLTQYSFRLLSITYPLMVIVGIYVLNDITSNNLYKIISTLICTLSIANIFITNIEVINNGGNYIDNNATRGDVSNAKGAPDTLDYNYNELGQAEFLPLCVLVNYKIYPFNIKYINDNNETIEYVLDFERYNTTIVFNCNNESDLTLLVPFTYYKGYQTFELIEGNWVKIETTYSNDYKQITINSTKGEHTYQVAYVGTSIQYMSLKISIGTFLLLIIYSIFNSRHIIR